MTGRSRAWGPLPPGSGRGDAARQAGPVRLPQESKGWPLWQNRRTPNQDALKSPAPAQSRPASSLLPHVSPLNAIWAFHLPASSTSPRRPWPPLGVSPGGGQWVHQLQRMPPRPTAAPPARQVGFSRHAGWGLGPGARGSCGSWVRATCEHPAWMVGAARDAAPRPVGCSWSSLGAGRTGWDGVGGTGARPGQDQTCPDTQPAVWLPSRLLRFLSVSLPVWPKRPVPQQPCAVSAC